MNLLLRLLYTLAWSHTRGVKFYILERASFVVMEINKSTLYNDSYLSFSAFILQKLTKGTI